MAASKLGTLLTPKRWLYSQNFRHNDLLSVAFSRHLLHLHRTDSQFVSIFYMLVECVYFECRPTSEKLKCVCSDSPQ
jgi:hypothetical protein